MTHDRLQPYGLLICFLFRIALCGIKFFYQRTLRREWPTFDLVRPVQEKKLPVVLSRGKVRQVLGCTQRQRYRVCLSTIYSCELRLQEEVKRLS